MRLEEHALTRFQSHCTFNTLGIRYKMKTRIRVLLSTESTSRKTAVLAGRYFSALAETPCWTITSRDLLRRDAFLTVPISVSSIYSFEQGSQLRSFALKPISRRFSTHDAVQDTNVSVRADFWGEHVTFVSSGDGDGDFETAVASMDDVIIAVVAKGCSWRGGGDDEGVPIVAAHSHTMTCPTR